jgi:hypothetical protein
MPSISATFWVTMRAVNDDDAAIGLLAAHASPALPICPIRRQPPDWVHVRRRIDFASHPAEGAAGGPGVAFEPHGEVSPRKRVEEV